ncbi:hypothetical protein CsSME_00028959 [Camellia sinensis var. sinensis]
MAVIYRCFEKVLSATDITYTLEIPRTAAYLPENNDASMHVWDQRDKAWELRMTIREDQRKALKRKEWLRLATENDAEVGETVRFYFIRTPEGDSYYVKFEGPHRRRTLLLLPRN